MDSYVLRPAEFKFIQYNGDVDALVSAFAELESPPDFRGPLFYFAKYHNSDVVAAVPNPGRGGAGETFDLRPGYFLGRRVNGDGSDMPFVVYDADQLNREYGLQVASED